MTTSLSKEDIIRIALNCGGLLTDIDEIIADCMDVERFADLVAEAERKRKRTKKEWTDHELAIAADEREECAKVCENIAIETYGMTNLREYGECANAIRARGQ